MTSNACGQCRQCLRNAWDGQGFPPSVTRMVLCVTCGNKRCPKANDCANECTESNSPGQVGSAYEGIIPITERNPADVQDIVRRLDLATSRLASESQDEATARRNKTIVDAKAEIETLRAALQQSRSAERAAIVKWLRGEVPTDYTDPEYDIGINLADAIERDQHLQEQSNAE